MLGRGRERCRGRVVDRGLERHLGSVEAVAGRGVPAHACRQHLLGSRPTHRGSVDSSPLLLPPVRCWGCWVVALLLFFHQSIIYPACTLQDDTLRDLGVFSAWCHTLLHMREPQLYALTGNGKSTQICQELPATLLNTSECLE